MAQSTYGSRSDKISDLKDQATDQLSKAADQAENVASRVADQGRVAGQRMQDGNAGWGRDHRLRAGRALEIIVASDRRVLCSRA